MGALRFLPLLLILVVALLPLLVPWITAGSTRPFRTSSTRVGWEARS